MPSYDNGCESKGTNLRGSQMETDQVSCGMIIVLAKSPRETTTSSEAAIMIPKYQKLEDCGAPNKVIFDNGMELA